MCGQDGRTPLQVALELPSPHNMHIAMMLLKKGALRASSDPSFDPEHPFHSALSNLLLAADEEKQHLAMVVVAMISLGIPLEGDEGEEIQLPQGSPLTLAMKCEQLPVVKAVLDHTW